jgi:hypothetical protein
MDYVLFREFANPLKWVPASPPNRTSVGPICPGTSSQNSVLLHDLCYGFRETHSLNHCGCKCNSYVALVSGDTDTWICCICRTNDFLTDVSSLVSILSSFSSVNRYFLLHFFYSIQTKQLLKIISRVCNFFFRL